ncbi:MAG: YibE/F family protein, partial [Synergistaceae bacterium]|nr:YibE/F family protein [Synergistaceae bacterium]
MKRSFAAFSCAGYLFRLLLAIAAALAVYFAVDYHTLKNWNTEESLVVEAVDVGNTRLLPSEEREDETDPFRTTETELALRLLTGEKKGQTFSIVVTQMEGSGVEFGRRSRYILLIDAFEDGSVQYSIADAYRVPSVAGFVVLICGVLMALAGRSGVRALAGLLLSIIFLLWGYIPLVASGMSPMPLAFLAVLLIASVTVLCVVHRRRARVVALLGTLGGAAGAFALGYLLVIFWRLSGLSGENASLLFTTMPGIDIRGILLASIIISAIGAVLDVGISITAAMSELVEYDPEISPLLLWSSGIRVGGEVLGSMINTLILAY